jgi:hypothetical protein
VSLLFVAAACVVLLGLPAAANADEMKVAKRWAVGLNASPFFGYAPSVEYWTSENFGLSASYSWYWWWSIIGVRGTYLFNNPIHIFSMPARPYVGAGLGFISWGVNGEYAAYNSVGGEVFGGLFQPFSDQLSVRAELEVATYGLTSQSGSRSFSPLSIGVGIFYHFGH